MPITLVYNAVECLGSVLSSPREALRAELWVGAVFLGAVVNGPLVSVASAHRSSRSEWGHSNEETVDKKCFRQCFCSQTKEGADVLSFFWRTVLFLLWSGLDAAVCWVFLHAGCLSKSIYVLSLDHYWLFIVLWSCYYLPVVDQNRFL